jgi:hypothetical protein
MALPATFAVGRDGEVLDTETRSGPARYMTANAMHAFCQEVLHSRQVMWIWVAPAFGLRFALGTAKGALVDPFSSSEMDGGGAAPTMSWIHMQGATPWVP